MYLLYWNIDAPLRVITYNYSKYLTSKNSFMYGQCKGADLAGWTCPPSYSSSTLSLSLSLLFIFLIHFSHSFLLLIPPFPATYFSLYKILICKLISLLSFDSLISPWHNDQEKQPYLSYIINATQVFSWFFNILTEKY